MSVQNGATVQVQNDAVWNLKGGTMDFGPAGATATLSEQSGGRVFGGQLTATRALSTPSSADPAGLGLQITASADLGNVDVTRGHAVQTGNGNPSIERYYDLSPSQNGSGLNAELTFSYDDAELGGRTETKLAFFKSDDGGSNWSGEGFDSRDDAANTVTLGGIASLSRWTLGSEDNPLPVERSVERVELRKTFPNPAREQVTVRFAMPERQPVSLQMYDVLGRQVQTGIRGEADGRQERKMNVSELPTATYFLRLVTEGDTHTQKLTVVR